MWNARKHGGSKRRVWRKIHIGIDEETLEVRAVEVIRSNIGDAPMQWSHRARVQSPGNQRAPEQLLVTMRSMRNDIWAAPCGDAGADTTVEAASKPNALYETTRPIVDGAGLRAAGRRNPNPHRRPQSLHCSWETCHRTCRLSASGQKGKNVLHHIYAVKPIT